MPANGTHSIRPHASGDSAAAAVFEVPDPTIYDAFCRTLVDRCLIRGGLASEEGLQALIEASVQRLVEPVVVAPLPDALPREAAA